MSRKTATDFETDRRVSLRHRLRDPRFHKAWNSDLDPYDLPSIARFENKWQLPCLAWHVWKLKGLKLSYRTLKDFERQLLKDVRSDRLYGDLLDKLTRKAAQGLRQRGYKVSRLHARKADFQLRVFDLHIRAKQSFAAIAKQTGENRSTCKMAYRAALQHIVGPKGAIILFGLGTSFTRHALLCAEYTAGRLCPKCVRIRERSGNRPWIKPEEMNELARGKNILQEHLALEYGGDSD